LGYADSVRQLLRLFGQKQPAYAICGNQCRISVIESFSVAVKRFQFRELSSARVIKRRCFNDGDGHWPARITTIRSARSDSLGGGYGTKKLKSRSATLELA
jgi:hypothetical protein